MLLVTEFRIPVCQANDWLTVSNVSFHATTLTSSLEMDLSYMQTVPLHPLGKMNKKYPSNNSSSSSGSSYLLGGERVNVCESLIHSTDAV